MSRESKFPGFAKGSSDFEVNNEEIIRKLQVELEKEEIRLESYIETINGLREAVSQSKKILEEKLKLPHDELIDRQAVLMKNEGLLQNFKNEANTLRQTIEGRKSIIAAMQEALNAERKDVLSSDPDKELPPS